jgi:RNA polymerase sigma-70 factor, ECF subfamily
MTQEESKLIMEAQRGDETAFEQLIYLYDKNVLAIAYSYTKNREDAKDIYQDVFIRVFKGIKKFEFRSEFSTWLYRITTNVCLTYKDKKVRHKISSLDEELTGEDGETRTYSDMLEGESRTDESAESTDISTRIDEGVEKLSPQQKMVFTLKHFKGYKIKEIAAAMNCAEGTVKNYLFIATQKMREHLKRALE